jgi:glycosyltransferase involved in cell wall biosynthesis
MNTIDVSAIVPTFRRPTQLIDAVRSALSQEGVSVEVRVVDDSPEGSAREVIESVSDPRVTYAKRATPSLGRPAVIRNEVWPLALGRYVHFLDDDDILVPGAYRAHVEALDSNLPLGMSFGCVEPFGDDPVAVTRERAFWQGGAERARWASKLGRFALVATMLFDGAILQNSACMLRKSLLEETGGFDPLLPVQEDTELHVRGTRLHGAVFIDRTVIRYRVNPKSLMRADDAQSRLTESYARMHRKYRDAHGSAEFFAMKLFVRGHGMVARFGRRHPRSGPL